MAFNGDIDLKGIVIDFPRQRRLPKDPDIMAVSQMNFITGLSVPVAVGSSLPMKSRDDIQPNASPTDHNGVRLVLDVLRKSRLPTVINITGSSRDIAIAGKKEPKLFAEKCARIYLNAGTGSPDKTRAKLGYNVMLGPVEYAALFDLPCPVYWMPCFEEIESRDDRVVREYGTHYKFRQDDILPYLSDRMQNYFAYMLARVQDTHWLRYLIGRKDKALLEKHGAKYRHMWCKGGFLHAARKTVTSDGKIVALDQVGNSGVFSFDPVTVSCDDSGVTEWSHNESAKDRFIFHVRDIKNYQSAMTKAMKKLLMTLP